MSRLRPTSAALVLVLALLALCQAAMARPGDGITVGRLTLRPYVIGSLTYDSNAQPLRVDESEMGVDLVSADAADPLDPVLTKVSDIYYVVRVGTAFDWLGDDSVISGSAWGFQRRYQDLDLGDGEGFGERVAFARGDRDELAWSAFQSFERRFDFSLDALEGDPAGPAPTPAPPAPAADLDLEDALIRAQFERDLLRFGVNAGRNLRDTMELDVGYNYRETDYQDDRLFSESGQVVSFSLGRRVRSEITAFVLGSYGEEDNENYVDAVPYHRVLVGLRSAATAMITYNVGVGYQTYDRAEQRPTVLDNVTTVLNDGTRILEDGTVLPPESLRNPVTGERVEQVPVNEDDSPGGFAYNAGLSWRPTPKLSFGLSGRNEIRSYFTGDQREVQLAQLSAGYLPSDFFQLSLWAGYWIEEEVNGTLLIDDEGNESRIKGRDETLTAVGRIGFRPPQSWYELYIDVTYEEIESNLALQSYDRLRVSAGLRATY